MRYASMKEKHTLTYSSDMHACASQSCLDHHISRICGFAITREISMN